MKAICSFLEKARKACYWNGYNFEEDNVRVCNKQEVLLSGCESVRILV